MYGIFYLCLYLSYGFKTQSKPMTNVSFLVNVIFSMANVRFFSGRGYIFECGTGFDHMVRKSKTILQ